MALAIPQDLPISAKPVCPHFGACGGCLMQHVAYEDQLAAKAAVLKEMFGKAIPVHPSPEPYGYRHRMDYVTAFGKIGLRKRGEGTTVIDLNECHLVQPRVSALLPNIRHWMHEKEVHSYNLVTKRGDLRYITFRHAISSDELMVIAVTSREDSTVGPLLDELEKHAESVIWAIQPRVGDDSHGDIHEIRGRQTIRQQILGLSFDIGPNCFFQNNLLLLDRMFESILQHVQGTIFDLYCGVGTIGLSAAAKAKKVIAVDIVEENIEFAKRNATANGIENVEFHLDNANHFLAFYEGDVPDTVVVDPPRDGLAPKLIRKLNRLGAPRIVYVSCNPSTFLRDLELLENYELKQVEAFDMFPQTPHAELVTLLETI